VNERDSNSELFSDEYDFDYDKEYGYESISSDGTYHPDSEGGSCEELFEDEGSEDKTTNKDDIEDDIFEPQRRHSPISINSPLKHTRNLSNSRNLHVNKENIPISRTSSRTQSTEKSNSSILNWFPTRSNSVTPVKKINNPMHTPLNEITSNINNSYNNTPINSPKIMVKNNNYYYYYFFYSISF